jgi:hypothetical protein
MHEKMAPVKRWRRLSMKEIRISVAFRCSPQYPHGPYSQAVTGAVLASTE